MFAFESTGGEERLASWLNDTPPLMSVCLLYKFFIRKAPAGIVGAHSNDWQETLIFASSLVDSIVKAQKERPPQKLHMWGRYIVGVDPDATQPDT